MEPISVSYLELKRHLASGAQLKWIDADPRYIVYAIDHPFSVSCSLDKESSDAVDFENTLKVQTAMVNKTSITAQPDPAPFALPLYRTKLNATNDILVVPSGGNSEIRHKLLSERYVTGGTIVVKNAQMGDYITAEVEDIDGVIPAPYRAALCENWPVISAYIEKNWVEVQGEYSVMKINTYPLNAKISAGLYLCIHYYAASSGVDREIAINYALTKKL